MALRHTLLLLTLLSTLYANPKDFKACQLKYQVSSISVEGSSAFAVDSGYALSYSSTPPKTGLLKRDPFLGLNLIKSAHPFKHLFKFYTNQPKQLAGILPEEVTEGKILSRQLGLNQLARFSSPLKENALISGSCCGIVGLAASDGVIEKAYIQHFLQNEESVYADAGIRIKEDKDIYVYEVNPFFEDSGFLLGDRIVSMDAKAVKSAAQLAKEILFSKPNSRHVFVVERNTRQMKVTSVFKKRIGGGLIPESFFESLGIWLDMELRVEEGSARFGLKKGDRILSIMDKQVKDLRQVRQLLSEAKSIKARRIKLLVRRDGFDFFLDVHKPASAETL